jgi:hypothetical protein
MEQKDLIGMALLAIGMAGGVTTACISKRLRDVFFCMMVFLAPLTERVDINFVSRDWYRGTTRGFEVSLVDILAVSLVVSAIIAPRRGQSRGYWPASLGFMLLLFFYACFNVAIADPKLFGAFELLKIVRGLTIFLAVAFFLRSERELRLLLGTLGVLVCYEGLLALEQRYLLGAHRVFGTIDDSNSLSVFFVTTAPVLAAGINSEFPKKFKLLFSMAIGLACVGVILTISRTGVVTMGFALLAVYLTTMSWRVTARKVVISALVLVAAAGAVGKSWKTLSARFAESSFKDEYGNKHNMGRGYYIRLARAISEDRLFGVGLNNWSFWVSNQYGPRLGYRFVPYKGTDKEPSAIVPSDSNVDEAQAAPAHNLGALTLGELGIPGFLLFAILWLRWFQMAVGFVFKRSTDPLLRIGAGLFFGLVALFIHSLTEWVFRQSPIYYVVNILLGALAGLYYLKRQRKNAGRLQDDQETYVIEPAVEAAPLAGMHYQEA